MQSDLDPKGLEAAAKSVSDLYARRKGVTTTQVSEKAIRAYLSAVPDREGELDNAAVKRAVWEYLLHKGERPERVLRSGHELWETCVPAMTAALAASRLSQAQVRVKPLVWGKTSYGRPEVETIVGFYRVFEHVDGGWAATFRSFNLVDQHGRKNFATEEEAIAAAETDYETRIRSALSGDTP